VVRGLQLALLVEALREFAEVRVVATQPAMHFVRTLSEQARQTIGEVLGDEMEWRQWQQASAAWERWGCGLAAA
jgi:hypothetical protein